MSPHICGFAHVLSRCSCCSKGERRETSHPFSCFSLPFSPPLSASLFLSTCCHHRRSQLSLQPHISSFTMQSSGFCQSCPRDLKALIPLTFIGCPILSPAWHIPAIASSFLLVHKTARAPAFQAQLCVYSGS